MELKLGKNEIYAMLVALLLSAGIWLYPVKSTLPEFSPATQIASALGGHASPLHISVAASIAGMAGASATNPQSIVSFLLYFPPFVLALCALLLYLAVRQLGFGKTPSAFAVVLFSLSLSAMAFLPGVYSSGTLAALFFAAFLLSFASFVSRRNAVMLVPAALFAFLSSFTNAAFGVAGIAAVVSFGVGAYVKGDRRLPMFAALLALCAVGMYFSADKTQLYFSLGGLGSVLSLSPFLLAAASVCAVLFFFSAAGADHLLLFIAGIFVSIFSPVAGAMFLVLPAAAGMGAAMEENLKKAAKLASAFFVAFFAFLGMAVLSGNGIYKSVALAGMLAVLAPLALHFYEYRNHRLLPAFALALVALSLSFTVFYSLPPQKDYYPQYSDPDLSRALSSLSNENGAIALLGSADAARFYAPNAPLSGEQDFSAYLLTGKPRPASGSALVLSVSYLDDSSQLGSSGFGSYVYSNNFSSGGRGYALFYSQSGSLIAREIADDGTMALKDGVLLDGSGRSYGEVPLSRMVMLRTGKAFSDRDNRMLVLEDGAQLPYFMKIYSGAAGELEPAREYGKVSVYLVK